jgi:branched-chain amino acid transport system permease protein
MSELRLGVPGSAMRCVALTALLAAAFLVPSFTQNLFALLLCDMALINTMMALGLNVILKTGQVSMAQAGFMAIGAYTSAQLTTKLGVPFLVGFVGAGLGAAAVALVLGRVILRLKGVYFLLFTFALNEFLYLFNKNVPALTGGNDGIAGIPPPTLPFVADPLRSKAAFYYLALTVVALSVIFVGALYRSPFGRAMDAVRESELLAGATGYNPMRIKVVAFSIGCLLAGLGGSLYAHFLLYIAPFSFTFWQSVDFLLMNIVGGSASLAGPVVGAMILTPLPELLRTYVVWQQVLYGLVFIVFMRFLPDGVSPLAGAVYRVLTAGRRPQGEPAPAAERAPEPGGRR